MGTVGGAVSSSVCRSFNINSGFSSSSSSSSSNSSNSVYRSGEDKNINVDKEELYDIIEYIYRVESPSTNSEDYNALFNAFGKILTGSKFVHEGLLIKTNANKYYVCQTYPIQLKKCSDYDDVIYEIKSYWQINKNAKITNTKYVNLNYETIYINDIKKVVDSLPNYYDLFLYNCQHFCSRVLSGLGLG